MFALSKLVGLLLDPVNHVLALTLAVGWASWRCWQRTRRVVLGILAVEVTALGILPTGTWLLHTLEQRIPAATLPGHVDGVVVLGGALNALESQRRGQPVLNDAAERLTAAASLAHRYPDARVLLSGGNGMLFLEQPPETLASALWLESVGVARSRLLLEGESRNTVENAAFSRALAQPLPGQTWVLVTSAAHMPRALAVFHAAGFNVLPFPVDYRTPTQVDWTPGGPLGGLMVTATALHEALGLVAYRLLGHTAVLWPGP